MGNSLLIINIPPSVFSTANYMTQLLKHKTPHSLCETRGFNNQSILTSSRVKDSMNINRWLHTHYHYHCLDSKSTVKKGNLFGKAFPKLPKIF